MQCEVLKKLKMGDFISFSSIKFKSHTNADPFTWEEVLPSRKVYRDIQENSEADKGEITEQITQELEMACQITSKGAF